MTRGEKDIRAERLRWMSLGLSVGPTADLGDIPLHLTQFLAFRNESNRPKRDERGVRQCVDEERSSFPR